MSLDWERGDGGQRGDVIVFELRGNFRAEEIGLGNVCEDCRARSMDEEFGGFGAGEGRDDGLRRGDVVTVCEVYRVVNRKLAG
jgi:hypothetical protein